MLDRLTAKALDSIAFSFDLVIAAWLGRAGWRRAARAGEDTIGRATLALAAASIGLFLVLPIAIVLIAAWLVVW